MRHGVVPPSDARRCRTDRVAGAPRRSARGARAGVRRVLVRLVALVILVGSATAAGVTQTQAHAPALETSLTQNQPPVAGGELAFAHARAAGASFDMISVRWSDIAPLRRPPGFRPSRPGSPGYDWRELDLQVTGAAASGLRPVVDIGSPPPWGVLPGTSTPDPVQLSLFAHAAALRYDGRSRGLPRVRYWMAWNEPNASLFLAPQRQGGRTVSIARYRNIVNDLAAQVHGVDRSNMVVAGQLFPNSVNRPGLQAIGPLAFTRALFCLSAGPAPHATCHQHVHADAWTIHPYGTGQPSDRPPDPDSVWIGNLSSLHALILAARRAGTLVSRGPAQFWVTEFGWNTNPPNPAGVPVSLHARWVAEALYRMWAAGVTVASYFDLRDDVSAGSIFHSGLYYACDGGLACDQPKAALTAFRFPFVAFAGYRRVLVWGRTPLGRVRRVTIQITTPTGWRQLAALRTDGDGIFTARLRVSGRLSVASLRAVLPGQGGASLGFALAQPKDLVVSAFG